MSDIGRQLMVLLSQHHAKIRGTCQTGCDLEIVIDGKIVESFCCEIPETTFQSANAEESQPAKDN